MKKRNLKIAYRSVSELIPYVNNARTHSDEQVLRLASSIKEFGFTNPILVDGENGVIAGHGRLLAAKKLGLDKVPTIELADLTETQKKAYILADNKLALDASWDTELLRGELFDLKSGGGIDLDIIGFSEEELAEILGEIDLDIDKSEVDINTRYCVVIDCSSEGESEEIFNRLQEEGYQCRISTL